MDDFIYQIQLSKIENCNSVLELVTMFKELHKDHYVESSHLFRDGCVHFKNSYEENYKSILASDLLGNIYNRLIDSKQITPKDLESILHRPFPSIDKKQTIKNIKAFHGLI